MKTLIIGSKGMLGGVLAEVFRDSELYLWDIENIDITNKEGAFKSIKELRPEIIINSAAYNAVDKCEEAEGFKIAKKVNGEGPGYLAEAAKEVGAVFVHYSSDYVFPGEKREGYEEDDEPNPISRYGESKLLGERRVKEKGDKYYIIRTCKLFGPAGKGENSKESFVDLMLRLTAERDKLQVVDEEYASPTYVPDLAKRTKEIIDGKYSYGIYHATNSGACTWYEFAKEIFKIKNIGVEVEPVGSNKFPRPAKRPKFSVLLNTKLPPMRSWQEALREYLGN